MASLTDLFSLPFLMFLGILVLVVALVVVYFESKFREQNHKFKNLYDFERVHIVISSYCVITQGSTGVHTVLQSHLTFGDYDS